MKKTDIYGNPITRSSFVIDSDQLQRLREAKKLTGISIYMLMKQAIDMRLKKLGI